MDKDKLTSRRAGCLLGQCLGDALGFPVEGFPADECEDYLEAVVKPAWFRHKPDALFGFGQYTDDSQLARELLVSLAEHGGFNPEDYAARISDLFTTNKIVGRGLACDDAAGRLAQGIAWDEAGCPAPNAGNGTAMRAAPAGMIYYNDPDKMIEVARVQGWITHRDPRCDAGSIAIAGAVMLAMHDNVEPSEFCSQLSDWMEPAEPDFAELVRELPQVLDEPPHQAVRAISVAGFPPGGKPNWPGISPFVVPSVLWSLYCFLRTPDNVFESLWHSLACGGDVDSTAAMTGAISGAYVGVEELPEHLVSQLHDHGTWGRDQLLELVDEVGTLFPAKAQ